jgi:hypothetical protein
MGFMNITPGFDTAKYPGDDIMQSLIKNTNLRWVGYYLDYESFQGKLPVLKAMGWGVVPIHFGAMPRVKVLRNGDEDPKFIPPEKLVPLGPVHGQSARRKAKEAGFPAGTTIFLDVEIPNQVDAWVDYYVGWCNAVMADPFNYSVGCYCGHPLVFWLQNRLRSRTGGSLNPSFWVVDIDAANPTPINTHVSSGTMQVPFPSSQKPPSAAKAGALATSWQYAQNYTLSWQDGGTRRFFPADLSTSIFSDPAQEFS